MFPSAQYTFHACIISQQYHLQRLGNYQLQLKQSVAFIALFLEMRTGQILHVYYHDM